ncbi:hypothetical protein BDW02DRAFT_581578 [Decorospora gaudefroyi]|uniref:Uncharacterized protein n=1 Tax=Decorospora gaudefroyi TaxID=184978 RepID=A0A6A5K311_9PLEO|nr:hypothetical protein BDW02DRAFT_581578 [Decorospora gaudefroyi]
MSIHFEQPLDYPAALLTKRSYPPQILYAVIVDGIGPYEIRAAQEFWHDAITKQNIEAHLRHTSPSSFISVYESEATALKHCPQGDQQGAEMLLIHTMCFTPAWRDGNLPVWMEDSQNENVLWICLDELKIVLGINDSEGEKGEWLACGRILMASVISHTLLATERPSTPEQSVFAADQETTEKETKRSRRRDKEQRSHHHHHIQPPTIPIRSSSLSVKRNTSSRTKDDESKLSVTTRDARISLTNANQHSAASLMKYALLVAHGKRLEAEKTWLLDTTPPSRTANIDDDEDGKTSVYEQDYPSDVNTIAWSHMTPASSSPRASPSKHKRTTVPVADKQRRESNHDQESVHQQQQSSSRSTRSGAPSPSASLYDSTPPPIPPQRPRSRHALLLELQSDEDSILREYARVSLQEPDALERARREREQEREHADKDTNNNNPSSHTAASTSTTPYQEPPPTSISSSSSTTTPTPTPIVPPAIPTTPMPTPHPTIEQPHTHPLPAHHQSTTSSPSHPLPPHISTPLQRSPSRSEPFLAKRKEWRDKGREFQMRLVELRERQKGGGSSSGSGKNASGPANATANGRDVWEEAGRR